MDSQPHERVEISDYPGVPNVPPLATPAPQRGIKQVEGETVNNLDPASLSPSLSLNDNKLVLIKNKSRSMWQRFGLMLVALIWFKVVYDQLADKIPGHINGQDGPPEIINALLTHPTFDLIFFSLGAIVIAAAFIFLVIEGFRFSLGAGDKVIFDHFTNTITDTAFFKTSLARASEVAAVNLDQKKSKWRVALVLSSGKLIELNTWNKEIEAGAVANAIAAYLRVPLERTTTAAV